MTSLLFLLCASTSSGVPTEDFGPESLQEEERCQCNLFNEAVQLLTVEQLELQVLVKENALREKENEVESLKLELEKKQKEMEKSWTLVSYMMKVMSSSKEMMKSKEELVVTQAAKIKEMEKQVADFSQMSEDTLRMLNTSHSVIEAQEKTITELRKLVTTTTLPPGSVKVLVRKEVGNPADFFDKTFAEYKKGFSAKGGLKRESIYIIILPGEIWLGLDNLHRLTSQQDYKLKITMTDFDRKKYVAVYDQFEVSQTCEVIMAEDQISTK